MERTLENKVAIVTGASSGIGASVAKLYAAHGAKVVVSDINEQGGEKIVQQIKEKGGEAVFVKANIGQASDNEALVKAALDIYGRLDIACNNAGISSPAASIADTTLEDWDKVISVNLSSVFYGMKYQLPAMLQNGKGAIINMCSILGQVGFATASPYVASKHGVLGLTKNAALEYSAQGIRINAVAPAFIQTPLIPHDTETQQVLLSKHPIGRLGEPEEVAEMVLWLSSDKASFITGGYYPVDGAYLAQ
ncbi:glucose 1-dehydrogenase [Pontibacter silvestris]|uniref:Glucose 1-dehydrogenase n=1 Tax=Pontibacter silvestris TaxID=2305183 RepID=A0ABW4WVU7_9BACT|nr:glucose 1-dehydrogenase [Pontibacter silvestris]MCC9138027.1 glucose 1-dehydrogenase [Pontibacter silvestris]